MGPTLLNLSKPPSVSSSVLIQLWVLLYLFLIASLNGASHGSISTTPKEKSVITGVAWRKHTRSIIWDNAFVKFIFWTIHTCVLFILTILYTQNLYLYIFTFKFRILKVKYALFTRNYKLLTRAVSWVHCLPTHGLQDNPSPARGGTNRSQVNILLNNLNGSVQQIQATVLNMSRNFYSCIYVLYQWMI